MVSINDYVCIHYTKNSIIIYKYYFIQICMIIIDNYN